MHLQTHIEVKIDEDIVQTTNRNGSENYNGKKILFSEMRVLVRIQSFPQYYKHNN